jgi:hypothetical protein
MALNYFGKLFKARKNLENVGDSIGLSAQNRRSEKKKQKVVSTVY